MVRSQRLVTAAASLAAALWLSACATDPGVQSVAAQPNSGTAAPGTTLEPTTPSTPAPSTESSAPPDSTATAPATTLPPIGEPELLVDIPIGDVVNIDDDKPARDYDPFVAAAISDIQRWWETTYPAVYGEQFEQLAGGVWAGYPERRSELPGCGEPTTNYRDLQLFVAFYCAVDDFMMYDDGPQGLLADLTSEFGASVMGVVLAHEFGHAIQARIGALDQFVATIYTEQQADCFAGAWTGQAYRGESPMLRLGDADVRAGLIAMLSVRDPVGTNQFQEGGHGSAFDRVGAFQEGFLNGAERCAQLLDEPLTLMPNQFQSQSDFEREGNASYDCSDDPDPNCTPAFEFLAADINHFWTTTLGGDFPALTPDPVDSLESYDCGDAVRVANDVLVCPSRATVAYDEPDVVDLYDDVGDFVLGYFYGIAWAERAQEALGSSLQGETRALLSDCLTGAWVGDITPDPSTGLPRRTGDRDGDGTDDIPVTSSPGDLDEALQMAIVVGDPGATDDVVGSPFEKIESFRAGVLGGIDACRARFGV